MVGLTAFRRLSKTSLAAITVVLLVAALMPWGVMKAFANTSGNQVYGGFEIDGNLYDGTSNTSTSSTRVNGVDDWINMLPQPVANDVIGNADTTTFTGSKECSTPDGNCDPNDWARATGLAPDKTDIGKVFVASRLVPDLNGDLWGYFGVERASNNGTTFFDFELNQLPNHTNGTGATAISVPTRSPGDVLIVAQQQGSGTFTISGTIQRWTTDNSKCASGLTATESAGGCWTAPTALNATDFFGLANDSTITDIPSGSVASDEFAEFAINMTAVGAVVGCPSNGFVSMNVRSRASDADSAEIKDYVQSDVGIPSACGELKIEKFQEDGQTLIPGATYEITPNPVTGTGTLTVKDGGAGDADGAANGIVDTSAIPTAQLQPSGTTYTVTETVPPPGYLLPTSGNPVTDITVNKFASGDNAVVISFKDPAIVTKLVLQKDVAETSYDAVGDVLHYTYTLTNKSNVDLTSPYVVTDDKIPGANIDCTGATSPLAPDASTTCTATYTVTQADLDAGHVLNHATATATFGDTAVQSNEAQAEVPAVQNPALSLEKDVAETSYDAVGDVLHYTYTLTNSGNVTLTSPYKVTDDKIPSANIDCSGAASPLAPGDSTTCTATYTVTQADLNAGSVINHATATATFGDTTVKSNEAQAVVPAVQTRAVSLVKSVDKTSAGYGDTLTYSFTATNTGNVDLSNVEVSDVIPKGTTYVDGSASPNATFDSATKTVTWTVGNLGAGDSVSGLTFQVTIDKPAFDPTVGLPAETIDNVGAIQATDVPKAPSNHVQTDVVAVLGEKVVKKKLPFTGLGLPLPGTLAVALTMIGAGIALTATRRRRREA